MPKFTKTYVDALKPTEKPYEVWDSDIKGLGCMVHPTGRKTYYFLYRCKASKKQRLKVGVHGHITCDIAREITRGWMGDLARGINPKELNKKQEAEEKLLVSMKAFLDLYVEKHKNVHNKIGTLKRDIPRIEKILIPFFEKKKISEITEEDILDLQHQLRKTPIQFNRCRSILSKAFNLAELWGYRPKNSNPCEGIQKYPEKNKERFLTFEELETIDNVLNRPEVIKFTSPYSIAAIRLLIYTGCRSAEVLTLKWNDVFLQEDYLHLRDSKTGERKVPLNESAKAVLSTLKQEKDNPYVCIGERPGTCLTTLKTAWTKIRRLANLEGVRIHDLRHTFAYLAIKQGVDLYRLSKLLGHRSIKTTERYAHLQMDSLIESTNIVDQVWQRKKLIR